MSTATKGSQSGDSDSPLRMLIDPHFDDYVGFFDQAWAGSLGARVSGIPAIEEAVMVLLFRLRTTSNAFRFPWLTVKFHCDFVSGFNEATDPDLVEQLKYIRRRLRAVASDNEEVGETVNQVADEAAAMLLPIQSKRREIHDAVNKKIVGAFSQYLEQPAFQLAIVGLMRNTFTSLVFAYEDFFMSCFRFKANEQETRSSMSQDFQSRGATLMGSQVAHECWTGAAIRKHFEIRNSLAHNGGRFRKELERWRSEIAQLDGEIQITASENRALFLVIRERVDLLIQAVSPPST
jgi:hypothetical protein